MALIASTTASSSLAFQRITCRAGPKFSRVNCESDSSSHARGAKKVPCPVSAPSGASAIRRAWPCMRPACSSSWHFASVSITGPTSVASSAGSPTLSSAIAPAIIPTTLSAMSACTNSTRAAEQRCPAEVKAEASASLTSCSGRAEESAISAFWPPVSAISTPMAASRAAMARLIARAVSVEPVKATPATRGSDVSAAPTLAPSPGTNCSTSAGMPASCSSFTACQPTRLVCSAGLAITLLPAASAAATWPMKIASGKFQGLMHTNTPRPPSCRVLDSPVGPGSASGVNSWRAWPA